MGEKWKTQRAQGHKDNIWDMLVPLKGGVMGFIFLFFLSIIINSIFTLSIKWDCDNLFLFVGDGGINTFYFVRMLLFI